MTACKLTLVKWLKLVTIQTRKVVLVLNNINATLIVVFIHHHLRAPLKEACYVDCHIPKVETVVKGSPYFLQEQRNVLQAVVQLQ